MQTQSAPRPPKLRYPPQIKYIIGNETAERFSFYGMRSILVVFMTQYLLVSAPNATASFHTFVSACYILPLLGAYLSDRWFGRYNAILYLSLLYCAGHASLAVWESQSGLFFGLALIALGSGGIKPCIASFVGDQFHEGNKGLVQGVYDLFYFSVNWGSFFSTLSIPLVLSHYGPHWAFGIPGILMALAAGIFWLGRKQYVRVPPARQTQTASFLSMLMYALRNFSQRTPGQSLFDIARAKFSAEEVDGAKAAARVFWVLIPVSAFWTIFDQHGSSWVLQASHMNLTVFGVTIEPAQVAALNPILVMMFIPIFSCVIYPLVERCGITVTPLRRMGAGMVLSGVSFVAAGLIQLAIDGGAHPSVAWQIISNVLLTASEIMISITGLEFAYTQAPHFMKSTIMSFWLLTIFIGNSFTAVVAEINVFTGANFFFFFAALTGAVSLLYIAIARRYQMRDYFQKSAPEFVD